MPQEAKPKPKEKEKKEKAKLTVCTTAEVCSPLPIRPVVRNANGNGKGKQSPVRRKPASGVFDMDLDWCEAASPRTTEGMSEILDILTRRTNNNNCKQPTSWASS